MENSITAYTLARNNIKTADLIEFASDSILGKTIRWKTGKSVNHTSMVAELSLVGDSAIRKYIFEANQNSFHPEWISSRLKNFDGRVYWVPLKEMYNGRRNDIARAAMGYEGRRYDFKSLFLSLFKRQKLDTEKLYCSEACQAAHVDAQLLSRDFSPTGKEKHKGCGLWPGEFFRTELYQEPIQIL